MSRRARNRAGAMAAKRLSLMPLGPDDDEDVEEPDDEGGIDAQRDEEREREEAWSCPA